MNWLEFQNFCLFYVWWSDYGDRQQTKSDQSDDAVSLSQIIFFQLWAAPAFLCGTRTPHSVISSIASTIPSPVFWIMSHIVLSRPRKADLRCPHGNKVRGVQPKLCLVWRYKARQSPHTKPIWYPVSALTLLTPPHPSDGLLINPLCRQQKTWPRTQSPNHVIHHLQGQRSSRVTARCSCRGQRLMCLTTALFLMTSPELILSHYRNNTWSW